MLPGGRVVGHEGVEAVVEVRDVENVDVGDMVTTLGGPAFAEYYKTKGCNVVRMPSGIDDYTLWISEPLACVVNGTRGSINRDRR
ncbi:hypothetical protein J7L18_05455 [Candidatus Bathyarchaeota archaeon]|nr:hypothetical protein [Candidatus Bathyarchaeota archaeon]